MLYCVAAHAPYLNVCLLKTFLFHFPVLHLHDLFHLTVDETMVEVFVDENWVDSYQTPFRLNEA